VIGLLHQAQTPSPLIENREAIMKQQLLALASGLIWVACTIVPDAAHAQSSSIAGSDRAQPPLPTYGDLKGRWVRPDGGYMITIKGVDAEGKLDADYANPNPLPFTRAEASRDGNRIKVFFELRAGGYNGSTYTLTLDPTNDVLKGTYFQAVARQQYEIYFARVKQ
jgi:hypothetical protein